MPSKKTYIAVLNFELKIRISPVIAVRISILIIDPLAICSKPTICFVLGPVNFALE